MFHYRPPTKFAKVMFSQASVILLTGEGSGVCIGGSAFRRGSALGGLHPGGDLRCGVCIEASGSKAVCIQGRCSSRRVFALWGGEGLHPGRSASRRGSTLGGSASRGVG